MKKLLLLFAAASITTSGFAQENENMLFLRSGRPAIPLKDAVVGHPMDAINRNAAIQAANKGTAIHNYNFWFSYVDAQYISGVTSGANWGMYQDSNIVYAGSTNFNNQFEGFGFSLDPTSKNFTTNSPNASASLTYPFGSTDSFTVDSISILGRYHRNNASYVDTLIIDVAIVDADTCSSSSVLKGTYSRHLYSLGSKQFAYSNLGVPDSIFHFGTGIYDWHKNQLSDSITAPMYRCVKILNAAAANDTQANGTNLWYFGFPALHAGPGQRVMTYAHFKSGYSYPVGTMATVANYWSQIAYMTNGPSFYDLQLKNDFNTGLAIGFDDLYHESIVDTPLYYTCNGHTLIYSTYRRFELTAAYPNAPENPYFTFHLNWANSTGVNNVNTIVSSVLATPNPARDQVGIPFTLNAVADVNVYITNMLGTQVRIQQFQHVAEGKAIFDIATLPSGIYIYTVEANGQKSSGRLSVIH